MHSKYTAFVLAALVVACGDDEPQMERPQPPARTRAKKSNKRAEQAPSLENKSWNDIKPYFIGAENGFKDTPAQSVRDPFDPLLVRWVPRVEIEAEEYDLPSESAEAVREEPIENEPVAEDKTETERFKVQDYQVILIRWGTSFNKAVVQDPEGMEFVITKDMKLGNNNGRVIDITRYDVVVKEDSRDEPIVLSIRPELLRLGERQEENERLFTNQTSE